MKYHIIVFGCQMNISDSERVAAVLENMKLKRTPNANEADLIAVVMCSVRQSAVDRVHWLAHKIKKLKTTNYKLQTVLTGCVLKKDEKIFIKGFDYVIDIKDIKKLPLLLSAECKSGLGAEDNYLDITPKYTSKFSANVPIMTGCNNFCSYCVVPRTRDREISRPAEEIISEIKNLIKRGYKEIWLLGQNVNSYKDDSCIRDREYKVLDFPKLLKMVNDIPGKFELNFTSSHPKDFSDELIEAMVKCKKLSKRLNLPIQSGDDKILKKMNRPYTIAQYKNLTEKIRKAIPGISLSTDVIVGFPGETKKQFENTVKTFKGIDFDMAYINKYSPRPGTAAAKMRDDVPWMEKKRREKILINLVNKKNPARNNAQALGGKLIVVLGPTASGKTDLSIKLAKKYNAEVVSADSRQIYKGMDIGTAKITKKEMRGVSHYLLSVANPKRKFTVSQYQKLALKAIKDIQKRGKLPFLVGGSPFYIQSVVDGILIPEVKPDWKLRKKLEKISNKELFSMLKKIDPKRAGIIDKNNPRRLIRALEIVIKTGKPVPNRVNPGCGPYLTPFDVLKIGVNKSPEGLKKSIQKRLLRRLKNNAMINEVKKLRRSGLSFKRLEEFGLEYRFVAQYLRGKLTYEEMITKIQKKSEHFAKKQMTWFKKDKKIHWVKNQKEAEGLLKQFIK